MARNTSKADTVGMPPALATGYDDAVERPSTPWVTLNHSSTGRNGRGINLRPVAEVLASYGMDPAVELVKAIQEIKPVLAGGKPVLDDDGRPMYAPVLDTDVRSRLFLELLQYTRPKLKAVEVTIKPPELTDEQVERRIKALAAKAAGGHE